MKRKTSKILFFICLAVFLIGITLLAMPFEFENYSYSNSPSSTLNVHDKHGFKFSVNIKNYTDEELENVKVEVRYSYKEELVKYSSLATFHNVNIDDSETLQVELEKEGFGLAIFSKVEYVKITLDNGYGKSFEIYKSTFFAGPNWAFISMAIVSFFAGVICFISWKHDPSKFISQETSTHEEFENSLSTFEERIKEAFAPAKPKSEKTVCPYCKCKYNTEKFDKCPNCGAPPEH